MWAASWSPGRGQRYICGLGENEMHIGVGNVWGKRRSEGTTRKSARRACLLLIVFGAVPHLRVQAQTYHPGLTTVGSNATTSVPAASEMSIDASQFFPAASGDFCGAVASACALVNSKSYYPFGVTIDARGMAGNQYCSAANATQMLTTCVTQGTQMSPIQVGSGKLLLGEVNLYIDGPTGNNYVYQTGDGPGTPAIVIPDGFWGIEGISRVESGVSGTAVRGSVISVCTSPTQFRSAVRPMASRCGRPRSRRSQSGERTP